MSRYSIDSPRILQCALARILRTVRPPVPAAVDQPQLEIAPVLSFATGARFQVQVTEPDLDGGVFIVGDLAALACTTITQCTEQVTYLDKHSTVPQSHIQRSFLRQSRRPVQPDLGARFLPRL